MVLLWDETGSLLCFPWGKLSFVKRAIGMHILNRRCSWEHLPKGSCPQNECFGNECKSSSRAWLTLCRQFQMKQLRCLLEAWRAWELWGSQAGGVCFADTKCPECDGPAQLLVVLVLGREPRASEKSFPPRIHRWQCLAAKVTRLWVQPVGETVHRCWEAREAGSSLTAA